MVVPPCDLPLPSAQPGLFCDGALQLREMRGALENTSRKALGEAGKEQPGATMKAQEHRLSQRNPTARNTKQRLRKERAVLCNGAALPRRSVIAATTSSVQQARQRLTRWRGSGGGGVVKVEVRKVVCWSRYRFLRCCSLA